jgi:hypothetical protein
MDHQIGQEIVTGSQMQSMQAKYKSTAGNSILKQLHPGPQSSIERTLRRIPNITETVLIMKNTKRTSKSHSILKLFGNTTSTNINGTKA